MDKLIKQYEDKFSETFPLMLCRGMSDKDIKEAIQECLNENEPYTVGDGDY